VVAPHFLWLTGNALAAVGPAWALRALCNWETFRVSTGQILSPMNADGEDANVLRKRVYGSGYQAAIALAA
jgi:hypothetical protein